MSRTRVADPRASGISAADPSASGTPVADPRTYRGRTIEDLIPRIQRDLGADAIILRRREGLTGGLAGFFQRPFVELEAMQGGPRVDLYDEDTTPVSTAPVSMLGQEASFQSEATADRARQGVPFPSEPMVDRARRDVPLAAGSRADRTPFYTREPPRPDGAYVSEHLAALARAGPLEPTVEPAIEPLSYVQELQELTAPALADPFALALERAAATARPARAPATGSASDAFTADPYAGAAYASSVASNASPPNSPSVGGAANLRARRSERPSRGRAQADILRRLLGLGVSEQFAEELIDAASAHILPLSPHSGLIQAVRLALIQRIPLAPPLPVRGAAITLVGPGGAGKTSCAAALLGAYRKSSTLPASCATLVRGSKRGELQMLLSPHVMKFLAIESPRAVKALRKTRGEGMLVIDTPPLSPGDRSGIRRLGALLGGLEPERVVVVLPATLGAVAAAQLLQALRPLGANALAVSHADETDQIGVAVEAACRFGLAPEYMLDRARSGGWRLSRLDPTGLAAKLLQ
jgi:flagellar biosynthesis GTPase FlhF